MSGTTPILGLPYPDPTDPLAEGADAIKALAEAVDTGISQRLTNADAYPSSRTALWAPMSAWPRDSP